MKRGEGTLYRQKNRRYWWLRIGYEGASSASPRRPRTCGRLAKLPLPRVTSLPENVREGFFTQAEVAKLVKHLPEDRDFVSIHF